MNSLDISSPWMQSLGWTFLHSLWQAPLIFLVMLSLLKYLSYHNAKLRHGVAVVSMMVMVATSCGTFIGLQKPTSGPTLPFPQVHPSALFEFSPEVNEGLTFSIHYATTWVNTHLDGLLLFWSVGFTLFFLRLTMGFWYVHHLRKNANEITGFLSQRVQELAAQLQLDRFVALAEARIDSPQVIGYVKPVILFPVGLMSGLTTEQVEAILIHELSHIKRHDFLVNLFQSVAEAIFFFNPFAWMISHAINKEREHCCDDMVLANGSAPLTYAKTLAQLEEARLSMPLVLSLTGNKNQLLDRIKRIMEKKVIKDSGRTRFLPILLVVLGLVFASWLSIDHEENQENVNLDQDKVVATDTTKEKSKTKSATYERRKVTRWDENGEPHEEITETIAGDGDSSDWSDYAFAMPVVPDMPAFPNFPGVPAPLTDLMLMPPMNFYLDSIPDRQFFKLNEEEWATFEKEFTTKFKEQFNDFYNKNGDQLEKLMDEAKKKSYALHDSGWEKDFRENMRLMEKELAMIEPRLHDFEKSLPDMERMEEDMKRSQEDMIRHEKDMLRHEKDMQRWKLDMERHEQEMKIWEEKSKQFEKELKEQLTKDGYLSKTESIERLSFDDEGEITVNGKKVKDSDKPKYRDLHGKYFKKGSTFHREE